jgi:hypothetical protein
MLHRMVIFSWVEFKKKKGKKEKTDISSVTNMIIKMLILLF